jgi:hypothetical protein
MNPTPPPPSDGPGSQSDAIDSPIIFIDCVMDNTIRPARRDIRFMPPDAFELPPMPAKPRKKKSDDGPTDDA